MMTLTAPDCESLDYKAPPLLPRPFVSGRGGYPAAPELDVRLPDGSTRHVMALSAHERAVVLLLREATAAAGGPSAAAQQALLSLSPREHDVARLTCRGLSNKEIARQLGISLNTVKNHLTLIYRKLGVEKREEALILLLPALASDERSAP